MLDSDVDNRTAYSLLAVIAKLVCIACMSASRSPVQQCLSGRWRRQASPPMCTRMHCNELHVHILACMFCSRAWTPSRCRTDPRSTLLVGNIYIYIYISLSLSLSPSFPKHSRLKRILLLSSWQTWHCKECVNCINHAWH